MVKKKVLKKSAKNTQKTLKKGAKAKDSYIDWKIPAAFIAGILVTALYFGLPDIDFAPTTSPDQTITTLFILNDPGCALCEDSWIEPRVQEDVNITIQRIDSNSAQGQSLITSLGITSLPAAFFSKDFEQTSAFEEYSYYGWVQEKGEYYVIGFDGAKDLARTESSSPKIDVFVMSMCPYGTPAQINMISLKKAIPGFELGMHYIVDVQSQEELNASYAQLRAQYDSICASPELAENYGLSCTEAEWAQINPSSKCELKGDNYYCSLHGPEELEANMAQVCAMHLTNDWDDFILAHIESNFNNTFAASAAGISIDDLNDCLNSDLGIELLNERIALSNELGVGSSPSYLFDNIYFNPQMDPATALCMLHPELSGCESISSLQIAQSSGSC